MSVQVRQHRVGDLEVIDLDTGACEARISLQGGQLLSFRPRGQAPVLWENPEVAYRDGVAIRQGLPVCWPWFGDLFRNPEAVRRSFAGLTDAPAHGLVRALPWRLEELATSPTTASVTLACDLPTLGLTVQARYQVSDRIQVTLSTRNLGHTPRALSYALHTYLAVSQIDAVSIPELAGCDYLETLEGWATRHQDGPVCFTGETDRIYLATPARLTLIDPGWQRRIVLTAPDSRSAIVWNPWIEKSRRLSQFAPDAWTSMLCIETARAWHDHLQLAPGETHATELTLHVETP